MYLSHDLPDMQEIESVYCFIWQWVNQPTQSQNQLEEILDKKNVRKVVLNEIWGLLTKDQFELICADVDLQVINKSWQSLIDEKWLSEDGKILVESSNLSEENLTKLLPTNLSDDAMKRMFFFLREQLSRTKMIQIPKYLEHFVLLHLDRWIESAIRALIMENERQYIIDYEPGQSMRRPQPSPIILDLDTGADQPNSRWDESLHQFLQLKHGCSLSLQSLKSVFISNVSYFKEYENLYGMSGTLGSQQEQERLIKIHDVDFMRIPTYMPKKFMEIEPLACGSYSKWIEKMVEITKSMTKDRAVLIICDTIKDVNDLCKELSRVDPPPNIVALRREADALNSPLGDLKTGDVVVATNLAGRGMDLQLSDDVKKAGGLHVLVANLPSNIRIEQQAFGRAARAGASGSGQLCFNASGDTQSIFELKQRRNNEEILRLEKVFRYYVDFIEIEEKFLDEFTIQYKNIAETNEVGMELFKQSFLANWSFWLDEHSQEIGDESEGAKERLSKSFNDFIGRNDYRKVDWMGPNVHKTSKINFTIQDKENSERNIRILDDFISKDPESCVAEKYYKFFFLSMQLKDGGDKSDCAKRFFSDDQIKLLRDTVRMLEVRKERRMMGCEMLKPLVQRNRRNLIQIEGLSEQRKAYDGLDNVFIDSINNLLGQPIYPQMFDDILQKKQNVCEQLVERLIEVGVLTSPVMNKNLSPDTVKEVARRNLISSKLLSDFASSHAGRAINLKTFGEVIRTSLPLASREGLWSELKRQKVLVDDVELFSFNKVTLEDVDPSLLEYLDNEKKSSQIKLTTDEVNKIFFYIVDNPEEEEEVTMTFTFDALKEVYDEYKFRHLMAEGCLSMNRKATFDADKAKVCELESFNSLKLDDFTDAEIPAVAAKAILKELDETKVIASSDGSSYQLKFNYQDFVDIDLKENSVFIDGVLNVFDRCFAYQIALQKLSSNVEEKSKKIVLQVSSNTHLNLLSDFVGSDFIEVSRVDADKSGKFEDILTETFRNLLSEDELLAINKVLTVRPSEMKDFIEYSKAKNLIQPVFIPPGVNRMYQILSFDEKAPNVDLTTKVLLRNLKLLRDKKGEIASLLEELVSPIFREAFKCPQFVLKSLDEAAKHLKGTEEFEVYKKSGLTMVIQIEEKKVEKKVEKKRGFFAFIMVIFIAIVQIVVGAVISVLSGGSLTQIGNALISEGIGDVIFAVTAYVSGGFSWSDYGKHKAISVAISVATAGIGALLSSGKNAAGLGFKLYGSSLTVSGKEIAKLTGTALIRQVGLKAVAKEVFSKVVKSTVSALIMAGVSIGINSLLENQLYAAVNNLAARFNVDLDKKVNEPELLKLLRSMFSVLGHQKLLKEVDKAATLHIERERMKNESEFRVFDTVDNLIAAMKTDRNDIVAWIRRVMQLISVLQKATIVVKLVKYADDVLKALKIELKSTDKTLLHEDGKDVDEPAWAKALLEIVGSLKAQIDAEIAAIIRDRVIGPILNMVANKMISFGAKAVKSSVNYVIGQKQMLEFRNSSNILANLGKRESLSDVQMTMKQKHENKLIKLMKNTKNPKLMASLIRQDTQLNMVGVEASALVIPDLLKALNPKKEFQLQIKVTKDKDVYTFGEAGGIEINLTLKDNHFVNSSTGVKGNDCLFNALRDQVSELKWLSPKTFRELLAIRVQRDPYLQEVLLKGWHANSMKRGAFGGNIVTTNNDVNRFLTKQANKKVKIQVTAGSYGRMLRLFGGSTMPGSKVALLEVNHSPPKNSYPQGSSITIRQMPAIVMIREDHRKLKSTGSSAASKKYRAELANLIKNKRWREALTLEIRDMKQIAKQSNNNYDRGLSQLLKEHRERRHITRREEANLRKKFKLPAA